MHLTRFINADRRKEVQGLDFVYHLSEIGEELTLINATLLPNLECSIPASNKNLFVLPIIGSCKVAFEEEDFEVVHSEELLSISTKKNEVIRFKNTDKHNTNSFLILIFDQEKAIEKHHIKLVHIDFKQKNKWTIINEFDFMKIGIFDSRVKASEKINPRKSHLFHSLNGCFEVENRLLNQCDSLILQQESKMDFEALSDNAILLSVTF